MFQMVLFMTLVFFRCTAYGKERAVANAVFSFSPYRPPNPVTSSKNRRGKKYRV